MVSPANRTILSSFLAALFVVVADAALGISASLPFGELLVGLLVFPVLTLLVPQLYFAWQSDDEAMVRRHLWTGVGLSALVFLAAARNLNPPGQEVIVAVAGGSFLALFVAEAIDSYRSSVTANE
jgi:hypothetical protein